MDDDTHHLLERLKSAVETTQNLLTESTALRKEGEEMRHQLQTNRDNHGPDSDQVFQKLLPKRHPKPTDHTVW